MTTHEIHQKPVARQRPRDTFSEAIEAALSAYPTPEERAARALRRARRAATVRAVFVGTRASTAFWCLCLVFALGSAAAGVADAL